MHRILRPGGTLLVANVDLQALNGLDRIRSLIRMVYHGVVGGRVKPPKRFGRNAMSEKQLCDLLGRSGFRVDGVETIKDPSRSSNIPVQFIRAVKV
jgi:hypothetical protein